MTIKDLEDKVGRLSHELREAKADLLRAKIAECGIAIGDIVRSKGRLHKVVEVDPVGSKVWLKGNPQKADGTFGKAVRHLFDDWSKAEPQS